MVRLDLNAINEQAPYLVEESTRQGFVNFVTDFNIQYTVGFKPLEDLLPFTPYEFLVANVNNKKSPRDWKLKETIISILSSFFEQNNETVLYVCYT